MKKITVLLCLISLCLPLEAAITNVISSYHGVMATTNGTVATDPSLTIKSSLNSSNVNAGYLTVTNNLGVGGYVNSLGYALSGAAPLNHYLKGNGTHYVDGTVSSGDVTFSGTQYGVSYYATASTLGSTLAGTSTTLLHGNAAGSPTWSSVSLTADVSGQLPIANGGTGSGTLAGAGIVTGAGSGAANRVAFWTGANSLSSDPNLTFFYSNSTPVFSSLGNVWVGTNDADHVFAVYGHTNNLAGFESDGTDSNSMLHIKNTGVQGPFFDFWSSNQRWAWGNASGGNFVLRNSGVGTDPVNGTTIAEFVPTGGIIDHSLTAGRVTFAGTSGLISDDSNFVWDNTNKRLGIGTTSPGALLHTYGVNYAGIIIQRSNGNGSLMEFKNYDSTTRYNWFVGVDYNIGNSFEIIPSTAVGGDAIGSTLFAVLQTGSVLINSTADTLAGQKLQVTGVTLSTAGFGSHSVTTGSPTSTGWTNSTTVNQILYVTAATGASLTDNAGNTEFSGVTIANFTPVRIQPNGAFVGTGVTYATGSGAHAW